MHTSFTNEHTVEYSLIYYVNSILVNNFQKIVPFYFWRSREGGNFSKKCDQGDEYKVIAVFPRRPKIEKCNDEMILVKINKVLFDKSYYLGQNGIPVFAGLPLINNIVDLGLVSKYQLFFLNGNKENFDEEYLIYLNGKHVEINNSLTKFIDENIFKTYIYEKCKTLRWNEIIEILNGTPIFENLQHDLWFVRMGDYKPVYLLLKD